MNQSVSDRTNTQPTSLPCHETVWRTHYGVAAASVDVTDLLNSDFELIKVVERAITHLGVQSTVQSLEDRLSYAEQVLTLVLDLQTDRVMMLLGRLIGSASARHESTQPSPVQAMGSAITTQAERMLRAQCSELNRLDDRAQPSDYARLKIGGHDVFSGMRIGRLISIIPAAVWVEAQIRLRAAGLLTPIMELKVARWIARGLEVHHAIEKVKWDVGLGRRY